MIYYFKVYSDLADKADLLLRRVGYLHDPKSESRWTNRRGIRVTWTELSE